MVRLKKHIFTIIMSLILLIAAALCTNFLWSYSGHAVSNQNNVVFSNSFSSEMNPMLGGQFQSEANQNTAPSHGNRPSGMTNVSGGRSANANSNYSLQIIVYAIVFLPLFLAAYYMVTNKKVKIQPGHVRILILTILGVGLLLRIPMALLITGHPFDLSTFKNWASTAANNFSQFYQGRNASDYPPLYIYVLFVIGKIGSNTALTPFFTLLLKLPSIVADIATAFLIYKLAKKYLAVEMSLLLAAFYTFNPAVLINSTIWGQVDSFFTLIIVAALVVLTEKKIGLATVLFTAAILMKPQGIIFLPVLFFELIRLKTLRSWLKVLIPGIVTALVLVLPFSLNTNGLWILKLYASTLGEYPYASVNAFNFFSLLGANFTKDASTLLVFSYHSWGLIAIVLITVFSWFLFIKGNSRIYASAVALLLIDGVFTVSSRMHERYLFPAVALSILTFIYLRDKRILLLAVGYSVTSYINTHFVLFETQSGINSVAYGPVLIVTSLFNVFLLIYLIRVLYDLVMRESSRSASIW